MILWVEDMVETRSVILD